MKQAGTQSLMIQNGDANSFAAPKVVVFDCSETNKRTVAGLEFNSPRLHQISSEVAPWKLRLMVGNLPRKQAYSVAVEVRFLQFPLSCKE